MGPHIYVLGLSLSCRSNSEKQTKFKITADTLMTYLPATFFTEKRDRQSRYNVIQCDVCFFFIHGTRKHYTIVDIRIYIFTRIRSAAKTKLNYVADIDRKDTPYTPRSIPKSFALAIIGCHFLGSVISKFQPILTAA